MREIKIRAFAHASRKMFYPDSDDGWEIKNGEIHPLPNTTAMICSGLTDKNGCDIYEDDIISPIMINGTISDGIVRFVNGCFIVEQKTAERLTDFLLYYAKDSEIKGNRWENPELW